MLGRLFGGKINDKDDKFTQKLEEANKMLRDSVEELTQEVHVLRHDNKLKSERISHLEELLTTGEIFVDKDTSFYNVNYFRKRHKNTLDKSNTIVVTFRISNWNEKPEIKQHIKHNLVNIIRDFCTTPDSTPIAWKDDAIKIFMVIKVTKNLSSVQREIVDFLRLKTEKLTDIQLSVNTIDTDRDLK